MHSLKQIEKIENSGVQIKNTYKSNFQALTEINKEQS